MRSPTFTTLAILLLVACALDPTESAVKRAGQLVDLLGTDAPMSRKEEASRELVAMGTSAIAVLISALDDARVYRRSDVANRQNLPVTAPQPEPVIGVTTVGAHCEDLLYEIVTPAGGSAPITRSKVISQQILQVDDWPAFWAARSGASLAAIHDELQPLVDEYWRKGGVTQHVPPARTSR